MNIINHKLWMKYEGSIVSEKNARFLAAAIEEVNYLLFTIFMKQS